MSDQPSLDRTDPDPDTAPATGGSRRRWTGGLVIVLAAVGLLWGGYAYLGSGPDEPAVETEGRTQVIRRIDLDVTVQQEGELEAVRNVEVRNEVHGRRTITWLIPEGTRVEPGQQVALLDPENLENDIERTQQELAQAEMGLVDAREQLEWQLSQNAADYEEAEVRLSLAEMDLAKYSNGEYPRKLGEAQSRLEAAQTRLETAQETLQTSLSLFARGFVTAKKVRSDEQSVRDAERNLESARINLDVLVEYEHPMSMRSKENAVARARTHLDRVKVRARSAETNRRKSVSRSEEWVKRLQDRLEWQEGELAKCTVAAPTAGLVVYFDDGRNDVAEGEPSHHRQTLLLLPDTDAMKAVVRVPENRVSLLATGMEATIDKPVENFPELTAKVQKISVLAESGGRWFNRESRQYPVDLVLTDTPPGLKPGLKVQATVFVERLQDVLAVPLACIYNQEDKAYVFVESDHEAGVEPREIDLGRANETHAQVLDGLAGGERVLELEVGEGRALLERFGLLRGDDEPEEPVAPEPDESLATASTDGTVLAN
jgi:HlyD family secretion protein